MTTIRTYILSTLRIASLAVCFISAMGALAQVSVEVDLAQEQFIPKEKLEAKVRITNFSGRTLQFGADPSRWLGFSVQTGDGDLVKKIGPLPNLGAFEVPSSKMATCRVDLAPVYNLTQSGIYELSATVRLPELKQAVQSDPVEFTIGSGNTIWKLDIGIPSEKNQDDRSPEVRRYALLQANHGEHIRLYLRISNPDVTVTHMVLPLSNMLSFTHPEPRVDKHSNLHLLYQAGARSFHYYVVNPYGKILLRQTHYYTQTRPVLQTAPDGTVKVKGGIRHPTRHDIPQPGSQANLQLQDDQDQPAPSPEQP